METRELHHLFDYAACSDAISDRAFVLIYAKDTGRFLAQHRAIDKTWSIPGGMVDPGETHLDTALRETIEEIGVRFQAHDLETIVNYKVGPAYSCTIYLAQIDREQDLLPSLCKNEVLSVEWVQPESWPSPVHKKMQRLLDNGLPHIKNLINTHGNNHRSKYSL